MPPGGGRETTIGDGRETVYTIKFVHRSTNPKLHFYEHEEKILSIVDEAILVFLKSDDDFNRNNLDRMAEKIRQRVLKLLPDDGTDWERDIGLRVFSSKVTDFLPGDAGPFGES